MIKSLLIKYPLFLLTIPAVFFVNALNHYFALLHWPSIVSPIVLYISLPFIFYFFIGLLLKSLKKSGIIMFFLLLIFYFFHLLYDTLNKIPALSFLASYKILIPTLSIGLLILSYRLIHKNGNFNRFYYAGNVIPLLLLVGGIIQYLFLILTNPQQTNDQADPLKSLTKNYKPCDTCARPDIYFIVLDSYTNSKTLKTEFSYSNEFIDSILLSRNFFLQKNPKSNYNFTHMSIGSELNMAYLKNLEPHHIFYTKDFLQSNYTIANNELCDILRKQGYSIENYSLFELTSAPTKVTPFLTELTWRSVMGQTFFNKAIRDIGWNFSKYLPQKIPARKIKEIEDDNIRNRETIEGIYAAARTTSTKPRFLYAHFLLPHETYLYDSSGKRHPLEYTAKAWMNNKKDYLNQLVYVNKFIIKPSLDSIFSNARRPFIIVLQSDHGYRNYAKEKVKLEFENLSAIYFPDGNYTNLNDSMSSVNTFRVLLNKYFNQKLPLLKDSTINLYKKRTIEFKN